MTPKELTKLKPCSDCGSDEVEPNHIIDKESGEPIHIWIVCKNCGTTGHSYKTYLEAAREWNELNK